MKMALEVVMENGIERGEKERVEVILIRFRWYQLLLVLEDLLHSFPTSSLPFSFFLSVSPCPSPWTLTGVFEVERRRNSDSMSEGSEA